jgi:hypothetical protein
MKIKPKNTLVYKMIKASDNHQKTAVDKIYEKYYHAFDDQPTTVDEQTLKHLKEQLRQKTANYVFEIDSTDISEDQFDFPLEHGVIPDKLEFKMAKRKSPYQEKYDELKEMLTTLRNFIMHNFPENQNSDNALTAIEEIESSILYSVLGK